jgi:hypothetical protein
MVIGVNLTSHEDLNSSNFESFFIYFSELQEESPMDKKHQKGGKKTYTGNLTFIYMTSCRKVEEEILLGKEIRSMKIGGLHEFKEILFTEGISTVGVTILPMMSKGEKEKDKKRKIRRMKIGGASPRRDTIFH